jgi:hypothetical protein
MEITRRSSSADYGRSAITLKDATLTWNKTSNAIEIKKSRVKDFSTESRHDCIVSLTIEELEKLLRSVANMATIRPESMKNCTTEILRSFLQVQATIIGTPSN